MPDTLYLANQGWNNFAKKHEVDKADPYYPHIQKKFIFSVAAGMLYPSEETPEAKAFLDSGVASVTGEAVVFVKALLSGYRLGEKLGAIERRMEMTAALASAMFEQGRAK